MRRTLIAFGTCLAGLLLGGGPLAAEVSDLQVNKSGSDAAMSWTTGTSPYKVLRSLTPNFMSGNATVAQGLASTFVADVGALARPESYFYQVISAGDPNPGLFDLNPPRPVPAIDSLTPANGQPATSVTIAGTNFAEESSGMIVMFGALAADVQSEQ